MIIVIIVIALIIFFIAGSMPEEKPKTKRKPLPTVEFLISQVIDIDSYNKLKRADKAADIAMYRTQTDRAIRKADLYATAFNKIEGMFDD